MNKKCVVDGCEKKHKALGYCDKHYMRIRAHGNPDIVKYKDDGMGCVTQFGYIIKGDMHGFEHRLIAEKALGRHLPPGSVVHHANGNKSDNEPENLVICPNTTYHALLHKRLKSLNATGSPYLRVCAHCKIGKSEKDFYSGCCYCKECEKLRRGNKKLWVETQPKDKRHYRYSKDWKQTEVADADNPI